MPQPKLCQIARLLGPMAFSSPCLLFHFRRDGSGGRDLHDFRLKADLGCAVYATYLGLLRAIRLLPCLDKYK